MCVPLTVGYSRVCVPLTVGYSRGVITFPVDVPGVITLPVDVPERTVPTMGQEREKRRTEHGAHTARC